MASPGLGRGSSARACYLSRRTMRREACHRFGLQPRSGTDLPGTWHRSRSVLAPEACCAAACPGGRSSARGSCSTSPCPTCPSASAPCPVFTTKLSSMRALPLQMLGCLTQRRSGVPELASWACSPGNCCSSSPSASAPPPTPGPPALRPRSSGAPVWPIGRFACSAGPASSRPAGRSSRCWRASAAARAPPSTRPSAASAARMALPRAARPAFGGRPLRTRSSDVVARPQRRWIQNSHFRRRSCAFTKTRLYPQSMKQCLHRLVRQQDICCCMCPDTRHSLTPLGRTRIYS
mmetsp:Transcript_78712/g.213010  ORF Transcript_78712/g.213010 Transcript_78712/m.213010 type:complete len:292 (+) Transcript_78712:131-1006(+)